MSLKSRLTFIALWVLSILVVGVLGVGRRRGGSRIP